MKYLFKGEFKKIGIVIGVLILKYLANERKIKCVYVGILKTPSREPIRHWMLDNWQEAQSTTTELNTWATENKVNPEGVRVECLNPGLSDYKTSALNTRPHCLS